MTDKNMSAADSCVQNQRCQAGNQNCPPACEDEAQSYCSRSVQITGKDPGSSGGHRTPAGDEPAGATGSASSFEELQRLRFKSSLFQRIARGSALACKQPREMEWQLLGANQAAARDHRHHGCLALRLGRDLAGHGQEQKTVDGDENVGFPIQSGRVSLSLLR